MKKRLISFLLALSMMLSLVPAGGGGGRSSEPRIRAEAIDSQKAARWCVEQGLMQADGASFKPSRYTFRPQVIKAWNDLQAMQKAG